MTHQEAKKLISIGTYLHGLYQASEDLKGLLDYLKPQIEKITASDERTVLPVMFCTEAPGLAGRKYCPRECCEALREAAIGWTRGKLAEIEREIAAMKLEATK